MRFPSRPSFSMAAACNRWCTVALLLTAAPLAPAAGQGVAPAPAPVSLSAPTPDPRGSLRPGLMDAGIATWSMRLLSATPPPKDFVGSINSDLAFTGKYAIQGSFKGYQVWDVSDPRHPALAVGYVCPASQSDVSVYRNLLFVSGENLGARLDCGTQGVHEPVSKERFRGVRIFDISDIAHPKNVGNVQTCRGSHTHTLVVDPKDADDVYIYVSGSGAVRPAEELPGCVGAPPSQDPNSALFRIEVVKVPLAHPDKAAIVSSPRIFNDLPPAPQHGETPEDSKAIEEARKQGKFVYEIPLAGMYEIMPDEVVRPKLDSVAKAHGETTPTAADSAAVRALFQQSIDRMVAGFNPRGGPTQCHDITVYPAVGLAGGACGGYGMLLDISDPANPKRLVAVSDSNFSFWHSATFSNDGSKLLFSDEWGGGMQPKCRATDPREWGADAIFTVENRQQLKFRSYYKIPARLGPLVNCVAHNGSMIPIPGRDVMVQAWYQGGISVFDFTDAAHPREIAYFDRGPSDSTQVGDAGSWSAYWYNGAIYSSEIARGLDVLELTPGPFLTQNEIDAARSVQMDHLNVQDQPKFVWPTTFALARAYLDQLERSQGLSATRLAAVRAALAAAESARGAARAQALHKLGSQLETDATKSADGDKVKLLAGTVHALAAART